MSMLNFNLDNLINILLYQNIRNVDCIKYVLFNSSVKIFRFFSEIKC